MTQHYDCIIIGAGVIGLTQAVALARANFKVAVIDQGSAPTHLSADFDTRVFALNRYSQNILSQLGIWRLIKQQRLAAYRDVALNFDSANPNLHLHAQDSAEPNLGHIVEQEVWRHAALETLSNYPNCDFYWEHTLENITQASVTIQQQHQVQILSATLVIGADGINSKVKQLCNIKTRLFPTHQTAVVANLQVTLPHHFVAQQYFGQQGILAFLPLPQAHHYSIVWSLPNQRLPVVQAATDAEFVAQLENYCHHHWGAITLLSKRHYFPLVQRQSEHYFHQNCVLIGDAAHTIHPLAGQGANLGLADVEELGHLLITACTKNRPLNHPAILKRYERARRSAAWQMIFTMASLQKFSQTSDWLNALFAKGSTCLDKLTFIKNQLIKFALYRFTK